MNYNQLLYIIEKEEDHKLHMSKKEQFAKKSGKSIEDLKNKKYKKNSNKADLLYKGRERRDEIDRPAEFTAAREVELYGMKLRDPDAKEITKEEYHKLRRAIKYLEDLSKSKNPEDIKKYKVGKKALSNIFKVPVDRDLYAILTMYKKNGTRGYLKCGIAYRNGEKVKLDKSKSYYHSTNKELKSLAPSNQGYSNRKDCYVDTREINDAISRQHVRYFYPKGRIYITDKPSAMYGKYVYKLLEVPEYGYVNNNDGYYITPDKPLKVKLVKVED